MPADTDPLKIAGYYELKRGRQALLSHIIEKTDTTGRGPTDNHRRLARLGIRTWVTTNYDDLLEQTLREAGERCTTVVRDQDLSYTSADTTTLVKLHGDRQQPDTIVITQQDYFTYFRQFPRVKDKLTALLLDTTFLFVGYSASDPDFNQIQAEIAYDLQEHQRRAYAVLFDADEFTLSDLNARNIHVLNLGVSEGVDRSQRLGELLDDLIRLVHQVAPRKAPVARLPVVSPTPDFTAEDRSYLHGLMRKLNRLPLGGVDVRDVGPGSGYREITLRKVYVDLDTTSTVEEEVPEGERVSPAMQLMEVEGRRMRQRPEGALEALADRRQMVLLGGPGGCTSGLWRAVRRSTTSLTLQRRR